MSGAGRWYSQSALPAILPVAACFALAGWHMRYDWMYDSSYNYGWFVPPLAAYLFSVRWRDRPAPQASDRRTTLPGWIGLAIVMPLLWIVREANPEWRLLSILLAASAAMAALLLITDAGGKRWTRHFSGPVIFFMACVPWPAMLERAVSGLLMPANAMVAQEVLQWMDIHAVRRGSLISLPEGTLGVEEACSGIRSLQTVLMVAWFAGELQALRWKQQFVLVLSGVAVALFTNILRTVALSAIGARAGLSSVATWHDTAGMAALTVNVVAVLVLAAFLARRRGTATKKKTAPPRAQPVRGSFGGCHRTGPAVLCAGLLAMVPLTEWWYSRGEGDPHPPWHLEMPVSEVNFTAVPLSDRTMTMLRFSGGWSARWQTEAGHPLHGFYFYWNPGKVPPENMNVHQPGGCLSAIGIEFVKELDSIPATIGGVQRPLRLLEFRDGSRKLFVLYFVSEDSQPEGVTPGPFDFGYGRRLAAVLHGRRNPGQRFIEVGLWDEPTEAGARAIFSSLLKAWLRDGEG